MKLNKNKVVLEICSILDIQLSSLKLNKYYVDITNKMTKHIKNT